MSIGCSDSCFTQLAGPTAIGCLTDPHVPRTIALQSPLTLQIPLCHRPACSCRWVRFPSPAPLTQTRVSCGNLRSFDFLPCLGHFVGRSRPLTCQSSSLLNLQKRPLASGRMVPIARLQREGADVDETGSSSLRDQHRAHWNSHHGSHFESGSARSSVRSDRNHVVECQLRHFLLHRQRRGAAALAVLEV